MAVARPRALGIALACIVLVASVTSAPAVRGASGGSAAGAAAGGDEVDLAAALDAKGRFEGLGGLSGTVDTDAWTLASDLASGAPPRFVRTDSPHTAAAAPAWSTLFPLNGRVRAMAVRGEWLFIGGDFTNAATLDAADYIVAWNGSTGQWVALGCDHDPFPNPCGDPKTTPGALNGPVFALAIQERLNTAEPLPFHVYVGGSFTNAEGEARSDAIARLSYWSTQQAWTWSNLGSNAGNTDGAIQGSGATVFAISTSVSPDHVFVGGFFFNAAGHAGWDYFARFSNPLGTWSYEGCGAAQFNGVVRSLAYYDDTSGGLDSLYVGGEYTNYAGEPTADRLIECRQSNPAGVYGLGTNGAGDGALNGPATDLALSGRNLYAVGGFINAGGNPAADRAALWDQTGWRALGSNGSGDGALNNVADAIAVHGTDVYVGGWFTNVAGNATADRVARWNGSAWGGWAALGSNGSGDGAIQAVGAVPIDTLAIAGGTLFVGGEFSDVAGIGTADNLATWGPLPTPATLSAPVAAVRSNAKAGSTIPLRISWSGSHPSGITGYRLQESVNGGSWHTISLRSPTQSSVALARAPGKTYRYRVRATSGSGPTSRYATASAFKLQVLQESSATLDYIGAWTLASPSYAYGGRLKYARAAGAWLRFPSSTVSLKVRGIAWVAPRDANRGKADVFVDGKLAATVDLYRASRQPRRVVFSVRWPTSGFHQLRIYVKGTAGRPRVDLDALIVLR